MVYSQNINLKEIKVFKQMLVIIEKIKGIDNNLQDDYKIFKKTLKESCEDINNEETMKETMETTAVIIKPQIWEEQMLEMDKLPRSTQVKNKILAPIQITTKVKSEKDFNCTRSVWECDLKVDYQNHMLRFKYIKVEMKNKLPPSFLSTTLGSHEILTSQTQNE